MSYRITCASASDRGLKRRENQDAFGKFPEDDLSLSGPKGQLFIVADGMAGHAAGKEASTMAVEITRAAYFSDTAADIALSLREAMELANRRIYERANSSPEFSRMGTTCTVLVCKDDRGYIAHVGDSRAYRITRAQIEQLTSDHSKVAEMLRFGILTAEQAKNHPEKFHLFRALGLAPTVEVDVLAAFALQEGEHYLLCTDGVGRIENEVIAEIVLANPPAYACRRLIELANQSGGYDNATVQVIRVDVA